MRRGESENGRMGEGEKGRRGDDTGESKGPQDRRTARLL